MDVIPIAESFERLEKYSTVTERYYTQYHYTPQSSTNDETHCILIHSNRICLITLAETHPIIKEKKTITKIDFEVSDKIDRRNNKVSGKGKKGAQHILKDSTLCFMECSDNTRYVIHGCIKGKLVEINENLLSNRQLLVDKPLSDGYIAIVLPHIKDLEDQKKGFVQVSCDRVPTSAFELQEID